MKKFFFLSIVCLFSSLTLLTSPVSADAGESFCQSNFNDVNDPQYKACVAGYQRGTQSAPICMAEFSQPVPLLNGSFVQPKQLQDACVKGYGQYVTDANSCTDRYSSDAAQADSCKKGLRPNQPTAPTEDAGGLDNPTEPGPIPGSGDVNTVSGDAQAEHVQCGIEGFFGQLVCDASQTMARMSDASFSLLTIFLKTPQITITDEDGQQSQMYQAWVQLRNLANIAFVIAFMVVIYSQLTGAGMSNYNIKKIMPRMIISALLINLSYYLCALTVDVSNVLGATLTNLLTNLLPPTTNSSNFSGWESVLGGSVLLGGAAIAAGAAVLYLQMAVAIPVLITVLLAIIVTVLMLVLRQALIVIFIVVSPLAMAAILLPNTKKWFDKWSSLFLPIVMLYPAIALVYGGCHIASEIIQRVGAAQGEVLVTIFALGIQVIPLLATPALMKLGGGLLNRYAGVARNSGISGAVRKKGDDYAKYRGNLRQAKALNRPTDKWHQRAKNKITAPRDSALKRGVDRDARRSAINDANQGVLEDFAIDAASNEVVGKAEQLKAFASGGRYDALTKGEKYQQELAQSKNREAMANAKAHTIHQKMEAHSKKVRTQALDFERNSVSGNLLQEAAAKGTMNGEVISKVQQEAAIFRIAQMGDAGGIIALLKGSDKMSVTQRQTLIDTAQSSGTIAKLPFLSNPETINNIKQGLVNESNFSSMVVAPGIARGDWSAEDMTTVDAGAAKELIAAVEEIENHVEPADIAGENEAQKKKRLEDDAKLKEGTKDLRLAAHRALSEDRVNANITGAREELGRLAMPHLHEEALAQNNLYDVRQRNRNGNE